MNCKMCHNNIDLINTLNSSLITQTVCDSLEQAAQVPIVNIEIYYCNLCDFYQIKGFDYKHYDDEGYFLTTQLSETQRSYQSWLLDHLKDILSSPIAEIGPGDGYLGQLLSQNYKYTGFEPALKSYQECLKKNLNVENCYFYPKETYKTIISRQVLEHIDDIEYFIKIIKQSLSIDGVVIFEVPNIDKARKLNRFVDFCPEHLNYFTIASLATLMSKNDFNIELIEKVYNDEYLLVVVKIKSQFLNNKKINYNLDFSHICFWGAGSRGISFCHMMNVWPKYFVDSDENKDGKYIPSTNLIIKNPNYFFSDNTCHAVVITGIFYFEEILKAIKNKGFAGDIYRISENNEIIKCG